MQSASAYYWGRRIFLHAYSKTAGAGLWVLDEPVLTANPDDPPELGRAILAALAGSKQGVPHPSIWKDIPAPLIKLAGAKSSRVFYGSARCVGIEYQDGRVTFRPKRNCGTQGFQSLNGKERISSPEAAELGATLLKAFQDAE